MKKDKLLGEFNSMKVSNPQEFVGGQQKLVPYDTHYRTCKYTAATDNNDYSDDVTTDYYDDEFVSDTTALRGFLGL